jgi:hypothetical protein
MSGIQPDTYLDLFERRVEARLIARDERDVRPTFGELGRKRETEPGRTARNVAMLEHPLA